MSDENTLSEEPLDELSREALERLLAKLIKQVENAADGGGKRTIRHVCKGCGQRDSIEVEIIDAEAAVKGLSAVSAALARAKAADKGEEASGAAQRLLRDRSELTDAELAEYIARLQEEIRRAREG